MLKQNVFGCERSPSSGVEAIIRLNALGTLSYPQKVYGKKNTNISWNNLKTDNRRLFSMARMCVYPSLFHRDMSSLSKAI